MKKLLSFITALALIVTPSVLAAQTPIAAQNVTPQNILVNPGFENGLYGWTASGGATRTVNSASKGMGSAGYDWDSNSSAQTLISNSITLPAGLQGKNGYAYCTIKTPSGTATHTIAVNDGTNDLQPGAQTVITNASSFAKSGLNFIFPTSGTVRIKLTSVASNEPEIYIDDCYIGEASNLAVVSPVSDWAEYTPTYVGFGTVSTSAMFWRRVGDSIELSGRFTAGTVTSSTASVSLPSGLTSASTSKLFNGTQIVGIGQINTDVANTTFGVLASPSASAVNFSPIAANNGATTFGVAGLQAALGNQGLWANGNQISFSAKVPIQGWTTNDFAVLPSQQNYDWRAYTPTFTGYGTPSSVECQSKREGSDQLIRCKFTAGTPTGVEGRVSLDGVTSAGSSVIPTIQSAGMYIRGGSSVGAKGGSVLIEPSVGYVTFGPDDTFSGNNINPLNKANGNDIGSGDTVSFTARIPVAGWVQTNSAPLLVGSVTSSSLGATRIEHATIAEGSNCTTGACTINRQSGSWLTSFTHAGAGQYSLVFAAGIFSGAPTCTGSHWNGVIIPNQSPFTATSGAVQTLAPSTAGNTRDIHLICIGPR